jgi:hypothetical protein
MSLETTETAESTETAGAGLDNAAPSGTADDEHRRRLHGMWAAVAPSWEHHADYVDAAGRPSRGLLAAAALGRATRCWSWPADPGDWASR